jgi:hypothetical protein
MIKNTEEHYIKMCLQLIEAKLGWGESTGWVNYDFEKLSEAIHERTSVRLSVTTLKRIWGKLKYESAPTLTTLNTLAQFAGHPDWRTFRQDQVRPEPNKEHTVQVSEPMVAPPSKKISRYWFILILPLLLVAYFFISSYTNSEPKLDPVQFQFKPDKIKTEGVPNSVVFDYDASAAKTDSVFIVQTWDITRKKLVNKRNHKHSAIYYYPGFFNTKLIADGQVVKTHELWVTSDGWLCLAEENPVPVYFKKAEYMKGDRVEVDKKILDSYNLSLHPQAPRIRFFNQRDMGDLMNDNFIFETTLKSDFNEGSASCQYTQVLIQCKDDIIVIPLGAKACVGDMFILFAGFEVGSKNADLSAFGTDLTQWTKLRIEVVNKKATLYVNDVQAYTLTFPNEATGIVGLQYRFTGLGAVKDTRFIQGEKIYSFD